MAITPINVGVIANDGTGDDLREAFIKINDNFNDLDLRTEQTTAVNVGSTGAGVYKGLSASELQFRKLVAGNAITITENENTIDISSVAGQFILRDNVGTSVLTGAGSIINFDGRKAAVVTVDPNTDPQKVIIESSLKQDPNPELSTDLNANQNSIYNLSYINNNISMRELEKAFGFDFGVFTNQRTSIFDFILNEMDVDLGGITLSSDAGPPSRGEIDFGALVE